MKLERMLGSPMISGPAMALGGPNRLRILAYHSVNDPERFAHQMDELIRWAVPVTAEDVVRGLEGRPLPRRATWITFDDGYSSVIRNALPVLVERGLAATIFVCPGSTASGQALWFDRVRAAAGVTDPAHDLPASSEMLARLKQVPDAERRAAVAELPLAGFLDSPATRADLRAWVAAGGTIGNHTWDHPCLDRCDALEQRRQIEQAQRWIDDLDPGGRRLFAYPNGSFDSAAEAVLREQDVDAAVLFDHRIADLRSSRYRLSRLRIAADVGVERFRAVLSGAHTAAFNLKRSLP